MTGHATFGGQPLRLNPTSVNWNFTIKTSATETVGGRVVQVYGTDLGDLTVTGRFGVGGWREQKAFLSRITALADLQVKNNRVQNSKADPIHFTYPARKWDFQVYLLGYEQPGAGASVRWDTTTINPEWSLRLFIVEDNTGVVKVAKDAYISRFAQGLGWKLQAYNGPVKVTSTLDQSIAAVTQGYTITNPAPGGP